MKKKFKFLVPLAKAVDGDDGALFVEGVASDTGLDLYDERISLAGQESMASWARTGTVALGGEANHFQIAFDDDLGYLNDGRVLESGEFYIRAELDRDNPRAVGLHKQLARGRQLGLSVFGFITKSHTEGSTPVIDGVQLERVMVTPMPVNPRTWLESVAKSLDITGDDEADADADATDEVSSANADTRSIAKGAFMEAVERWQQWMTERAPFDEQWDRIIEIAQLLDLLWDVAYDAWWASDTTDEAVASLRESIEEFKAQVAAKAQQTSKADAPADEGSATEAAAAAEIVAKTETPAEPQADAPVDEAPAVRVARSFADAAQQLLSDDTLDAGTQRKGVMAALANVAMALDQNLPDPDEDETPPAWATVLMERLGAVEKALQTATSGANVNAGSLVTPPENADNLAPVPVRKSVAPDLRPSAVVEKARTFSELVQQLTGGGLRLP
ncbi:MAG: hypothetical protein M0R37_10565 [Bacteroidales bacterium]|nr:hypothetical protein [Bacteroidales bacterium]